MLLTVRQVTCSLLSCSAYFSFGVFIAWPATALPSIRGSLDYSLSLESQSWVGSISNLGALLGTILSSFLATSFSARHILIACSLLTSTGWLLVFLSSQFSFLPLIYPGLAIMGLAGGVSTPLCSVFVTELIGTGNKGMVTSAFNFNLTFGILLSNLLGALTNWHLSSMVLTLLHASLFLSLLLMPSTPYELCKRGREEEMVQVILRWRNVNKDMVEEEVTKVKEAVEEEKEQSNVFTAIRGMEKKSLKKLLIIIPLFIMSHFSGINPITSYIVDIFLPTGLSPLLLVSLNSVSEMVFSFLQMTLADLFRRKTFLVGSGVGTMVAIALFAVTFWRLEFVSIQTPIPLDSLVTSPSFVIISLVLYFFAFQMGFGPVRHTVFAELCSPAEQKILSGLVHSSFWLVSFLQVKIFLLVLDKFGHVTIFLSLFVLMFLSIVFIILFVPETRKIQSVDQTSAVNDAEETTRLIQNK